MECNGAGVLHFKTPEHRSACFLFLTTAHVGKFMVGQGTTAFSGQLVAHTFSASGEVHRAIAVDAVAEQVYPEKKNICEAHDGC